MPLLAAVAASSSFLLEQQAAWPMQTARRLPIRSHNNVLWGLSPPVGAFQGKKTPPAPTGGPHVQKRFNGERVSSSSPSLHLVCVICTNPISPPACISMFYFPILSCPLASPSPQPTPTHGRCHPKIYAICTKRPARHVVLCCVVSEAVEQAHYTQMLQPRHGRLETGVL
jgi:hypothetical protein